MTEAFGDSGNLPADHRNRVGALDPRRSVCVTAPAGSGKTELLSQRVLRLLACVEQPEEILAITFTRKAAGEMHHRIITALRAASSGERPPEPHKQLSWDLARDALAQNDARGWHLLQNPGRLQIQTIDSLCASLTRQMPVLSNFGAQPRISDRPESSYRLAIRQFLSRLEQEGPVAEAIAELLSHVDNHFGRFERLLITMLQRRDQWLLHLGTGADLTSARERLEATLESIILDVLTEMRIRLQPYAPELISLLDYAGGNIRWQHIESPIAELAGCVELPRDAVEAVAEWRSIVELLLTKSARPAFRKRLDKNCGFPTETEDGDKQRAKQLKQAMAEQLEIMSADTDLLKALGEFNHLPAPVYPEQQWRILQSLLRLLPVLVAELTLVFQQEGAVDYTQISMAALDSLGDTLTPTELALKLDHRLSHILIDEFQDTSSTQFRLLEKLTNGWAEHNDNNPDNPHTLFLVGDGMQSIYGFREANVGLFLEARKFGVNGITLADLPLTVNFRSDPAVVDWNNQVFTRAFPERENLARGAVPYEMAIAFRSATDAATVDVYGFSGDDAQMQEARHIADVIEQTQAQDSQGSIAVLVRSRNHLQPLIAELVRRKLSWNATEIDRLSSYACIIDLLTLTRAMHNLADRVSWAALLRTPWFGFDNTDLYWLLGRDAESAVLTLLREWREAEERLSGFARDRLARQVPLFVSAWQQRQRLPFREWIEGLWMALGGPAGLRDERELDMVASYFDLLEQYQAGGVIESLGEFERAMEQLYAQPQHVDSNLQLMTIHKSKGLEFDTVILPALARSPRSQDRALMMWREYLSVRGGDSGIVIGALPATGGDDAIYEYLRYEEAQGQGLENTRLLYVAATRAIKRLVLSFSTGVDEKTGEPKAPPKGCLLESAWVAVSEQVQWQAPVTVAAGQIDLAFTGDDKPYTSLARLSAAWKAPGWSFPNPLADYYPNAEFGGDNIPEFDSDQTAAAVGTVVHSIFEVLQQRGVGFWQQMSLPQRDSWLRALLINQNLNDSQLEEALPQVTGALENTLNDGRGRWLLSRSAGVDFAELAVSSVADMRVRHRVVDRICCDEQGTLWIVDYKTAAPGAGESRQQFVERQCQQYRGQLLDYRWHVAHLLPHSREIKLALYFTAIPLFKEIDPGQ